MKVADNPNHGDLLVWPQFAYKLTSNLHLLFEARVLGGSATHQIGQYRDYGGKGPSGPTWEPRGHRSRVERQEQA